MQPLASPCIPRIDAEYSHINHNGLHARLACYRLNGRPTSACPPSTALCAKRRAQPHRCRATATEEATSEEAAERTLDGDDAQRWQEALESVQAIGFEEPEADTILRKAFGWSGQGYWRRSREYEVPTAGQVNAVLEFLRGLGFAERDVVKAVKVFPQIVGLSVEEQLQANVAKLKKDWKMNDKVIPGIVKRQPQVLGYNVDCEGNCMGECNRCWVRF